MTKNLKSKRLQYLTKADTQERSHYKNFKKKLNKTLGADLFSVFAKSTFDRIAKQERRRKTFMTISKYLTVAILVLTAIAGLALLSHQPISYYGLVVTLTLLISAISCYAWFKRLKNAPAYDADDGLMESSPNYKTAEITETWSGNLITNDVRLFIEDSNSGTIMACTHALLNSRNALWVILGSNDHRQALGIPNFVTEGPILYLAEDEDIIFSELEKALTLNQQNNRADAELAPPEKQSQIPNSQSESKKTAKPSPTGSDSTSGKSEKAKSTPEELRIISAKERGTFYEKEFPRGQDSTHLKTVRINRDMLKLVVDYLRSDEGETFVVGGNSVRKKWVEGLAHIYNNPAKWTAYLEDLTKFPTFRDELYGPEMLNFSNETDEGKKKRRKFRLGEHREISNFIRLCHIIPVSELLKDSTTKD